MRNRGQAAGKGAAKREGREEMSMTMMDEEPRKRREERDREVGAAHLFPRKSQPILVLGRKQVSQNSGAWGECMSEVGGFRDLPMFHQRCTWCSTAAPGRTPA